MEKWPDWPEKKVFLWPFKAFLVPNFSLFVCMLSHFSRVQLCDSMDCSPLGSSVHEILQARILDGAAMPSSRGSSRPRDLIQVSYVSCTGRWVLSHYCHLGSPSPSLSVICCCLTSTHTESWLIIAAFMHIMSLLLDFSIYRSWQGSLMWLWSAHGSTGNWFVQHSLC